MATYPRPTLKELQDRAVSDIGTSVGATTPIPAKSVLGVIGKVHAGGVHGARGYLDWIQKMAMPNTAEGEFLDTWASVWGLTRKAAGYASGTVRLQGAQGSQIPTGTILTDSAGTLYAVRAGGTIDATGYIDLNIDAQTPGQVSGSGMALSSPIAGVQSQSVSSSVSGGSDVETDEQLFGRTLSVIREPAHGGASFDYENWALEVSGVTRAWCIPSIQGPGSVGLVFVCDGDADFIPTQGKVDEVDAYLEARRPVTANVITMAPTRLVVNFTTSINPDTVAVRAAVTAALTDFVNEYGIPGATMFLSQLNEVISTAPGEVSHVLSVPSADVIVAPGKIAVMGGITWV